MNSSLDVLTQPFREDAAIVMQAVEDEHLPLRVRETKRSTICQDELYAAGITRARGHNSPHVWGLAFDVTLVLVDDFWRRKVVRPTGQNPEWDTGVDLVAGHCVVVRPVILDVWRRFGAVATRVGLVWGGTPAGFWLSSRPGDPLGWDPGHVQARQWRLLAGRPGGGWPPAAS